jgi:hypothetical protein
MRRVNWSWMTMVLAVVVLSALAVAGWTGWHGQARAAAGTKKVTLAGADFIPYDDGVDGNDWHNAGDYVECDAGTCSFVAPVVFPCLSSVTVERFKLHLYDSSGCAYAYATLHRSRPSNASSATLGSQLGTTFEGTTADPATLTSGPINKVVGPTQRAYVSVTITGPGVKVYGVTVEYHPRS